MAEKSLFAMLLRSPWWVSFAVVGLFVAASRALLPEQYMVFGVMGGLPFLVIGCITAFRQFRALSAGRAARILEVAGAMSGRDFGAALEAGYRAQGYEVSRLDGQAADLLLSKAGRRTLVACKRWKAANHGIEPLRGLVAARQAQDLSHAAYVTLAEVNEKTRNFARANQIELLHGNALAQLLRHLDVSK